MKYLVFSDVHANIIALDSLLESCAHKVDGYICLGDTVGYGPFNDECLEKITGLKNVIYLRGNHEEIFETQDVSYCSLLAKEFFEYSFKFFTQKQLLSNQAEFQLNHWIFTHSLRKDKKWVYIYNENNIDQSITGKYFIGHTHFQKAIILEHSTIVNPGSVGQNRKDKNYFEYAFWNSQNGEYTLHSEPYDLNKFISELKVRDYPEKLINYYSN